MNRFWKKLFSLDIERSIWIEENELGNEKIIFQNDKRYSVSIPKTINRKITLRLRGIGKTRFRKTGDLYLHLWLNRGRDVSKDCWLSETAARCGTAIKLHTEKKMIMMTIPPNSYDGLTIRLRNLGQGPSTDRRAPTLNRENKGNLLVKLHVFSDRISPRYGSFNSLSTENMALEGWVYRKYDEVLDKLGSASIPESSIPAEVIANLYNTGGCSNIFETLVNHFGLGYKNIGLTVSPYISNPGSCTRTSVTDENNKFVGYNYQITIKEHFLNNPFAIAAILAHELCHVVYSEIIYVPSPGISFGSNSAQATLEEERTVDLLVFMFKLGEYQLRVARNARLTIGYFNQEIFDRMQVIVSRKVNSL